MTISASEARAIARDAYIYGFPLVDRLDDDALVVTRRDAAMSPDREGKIHCSRTLVEEKKGRYVDCSAREIDASGC